MYPIGSSLTQSILLHLVSLCDPASLFMIWIYNIFYYAFHLNLSLIGCCLVTGRGIHKDQLKPFLLYISSQ